MSQEIAPDIKPIFSINLGAIPPIAIPNSPIIIDSDSSSDFSPLEGIFLEETGTNELDFAEIDKEISLELGEIGPISSPAGSSSQDVPQFEDTSSSEADTTGHKTGDIIVSSQQEITKSVPPKLCLPHPIVSQRTCATQTSETDQSNTFQRRTLKPTERATKFTPYETTSTPLNTSKKLKKRRQKKKFNRKNLTADYNQTDIPSRAIATQSLPSHLSPLFSHNYTMAAAATLSAAALLQPFLQMQSPEIFNLAEKLATQNQPTLGDSFVTPVVPQFSEGPSSTSDNFEGTQYGTSPFTPTTQFMPQTKRPKPTIKWRNSAQYRDTETEIETMPPQLTSPAITTPTNPLPNFSLTHLRNQTIEAASPDTTIPTLKTQSCQEPLFKLPSSQNTNPELSPDGSGDERLITYNANPTVAGGRRVIEFSDLAPSTTTETIENMARTIGTIIDYEFHQGLLYSKATVTYAIPKYALQCRRKYHMYYLDGVHIGCNFAETDNCSILKFPDI